MHDSDEQPIWTVLGGGGGGSAGVLTSSSADDADNELEAMKRKNRANKVDHNISYRDLNSPTTLDWLTK